MEKREYQVALFAVNGNSRDSRRKRICRIAEIEPCVGFLAAVFDFEWMVRRTILALSIEPTQEIKKQMLSMHGCDKFKKAWKDLVVLEDRKLNEIILNWADVVAAFKARHPIVHGTHGFIMDEEAISHMNNLLKASDSLENYLGSQGKTAFERIVRRRSRG